MVNDKRTFEYRNLNLKSLSQFLLSTDVEKHRTTPILSSKSFEDRNIALNPQAPFSLRIT